jgi:uroporphyrinogen decarboxylase
MGGGGGRLFERMHFLRGYGALLCDIAEGRREVLTLRDMVLDHTLKRLEQQLVYPVDGISFMDDWGCQDRLMIHPDAWRDLFKPAYRRIVDMVHAAGKRFYFHTDGYTLDILPDLIDIGVDVINPQFSCMDLERVAEVCAGEVCISSDIDRQRLLPRGTPKEIRAHVRRVAELFGGPKGGLIGRAEIGPDVPFENAEAVLSAFAEFGA